MGTITHVIRAVTSKQSIFTYQTSKLEKTTNRGNISFVNATFEDWSGLTIACGLSVCMGQIARGDIMCVHIRRWSVIISCCRLEVQKN